MPTLVPAASTVASGQNRRGIRARLLRYARDDSGTSAVEFAMVGLPFFMLMFAILCVSFYFFTTLSLESAVETAGRLIRTGQAQSQNLTAAQFKTKVCEASPAYLDCDNNLRVSVVVYSDFSSVTLPTCLGDGNTLIKNGDTTFQTAAASTVVLVTACYKWDLAGMMPFLSLGTFDDGAALIQAATTFRSEPFSIDGG